MGKMANAAKSAERKQGVGRGIAGLIILTLVAAAAGGVFGLFLSPHLNSDPSHPQTVDVQTAEESRPAIATGSRLVDLAPLVTNLAEPRDVWMRIEASILVEDVSDRDDILSRQVSEDIVAYLKTTTLAEFEGPSGFQNLREDLMDRARVRYGEQVKDLIIHGIVVE